ncbi:hypothetical protein EDD18DRAFT_1370213 [Armillaria luteobubalina]|uniref:Uncharacterized protein n=1 Tax=Armillaria luteobubalina TaxID=153913 RepID=A0AA39NV21_9AGAR|nr:hypothetical protein EDD18DRAFT_1370213 [Armillaria luteobubalina]
MASVQDKQNLSVGIAVGTSIQLNLSVTSGRLDKLLTLLFDPYESIAMFLAVLTVNYVLLYNKSKWLEAVVSLTKMSFT